MELDVPSPLLDSLPSFIGIAVVEIYAACVYVKSLLFPYYHGDFFTRLYGALGAQAYSYFRTFPDDPVILKGTAAAVV